MPDLFSKPARDAETGDVLFEQLLDTDEAAGLLKIRFQDSPTNGLQRTDCRRADPKALAFSCLRSRRLA